MQWVTYLCSRVGGATPSREGSDKSAGGRLGKVSSNSVRGDGGGGCWVRIGQRGAVLRAVSSSADLPLVLT
jgi:hypothetical protein